MKLLLDWLEDILAACGLVMIFAGAWLRFDLGTALLAAGGILLCLGIIAAVRK